MMLDYSYWASLCSKTAAAAGIITMISFCTEQKSDQRRAGEDKQANHTQVKIDICKSTHWRQG